EPEHVTLGHAVLLTARFHDREHLKNLRTLARPLWPRHRRRSISPTRRSAQPRRDALEGPVRRVPRSRERGSPAASWQPHVLGQRCCWPGKLPRTCVEHATSGRTAALDSANVAV